MSARAFAGGMAIRFGLSLAAWTGLLPRAVLNCGFVALAVAFGGHLILRIARKLGGPAR